MYAREIQELHECLHEKAYLQWNKDINSILSGNLCFVNKYLNYLRLLQIHTLTQKALTDNI